MNFKISYFNETYKLGVNWLSEHITKERKIVEDDLARPNQEKKTGRQKKAPREKQRGKL